MDRTHQCENCGCEANESFCPHCGQAVRSFKLPLRKFLSEFVSEALSLDSRLAATLKPLFVRPGYVPAEFVAGRRARFVPPARLYLFASFMMFLAIAFNGSALTVTATSNADSSQVADGDLGSVPTEPGDSTTSINPSQTDPVQGGNDSLSFSARLNRGIERFSTEPDLAKGIFLNRMTQAMFVLLPVFALLLKMVYRSRFYVEHLVYAVYLHAFAFLIIAAVNLPAVVGLPRVTEIAGIVVIGFPIYLFVGMRRMYGESRLRTSLKFTGVLLGYFVLLTLMTIVVLGWTLFNVS